MIFSSSSENDLGKYSQHSQLSMNPNTPGISTGNPLIDMLISMMMGGAGMIPKAHSGQSMLEAYQSRDRSQQFLKMMGESTSTAPLFAKLGNMGQPLASITALLGGGPDGVMDHPLMRALNGGNPVKEQMSYMAKMTGMTNSLGFGRFENATPTTARHYADALTKSAFDYKVVNEDDVSKVKNQVSNDTMNFINEDPTRKERFKEFIKSDSSGDTFNYDEFEKVRKETEGFTKNLKKEMTSVMTEEFSKVMKNTGAVNEIKGKLGTLSRVAAKMSATRGYESQDLAKSFSVALDSGLFRGYEYEQIYKNDAEARGITPSEKGRDEFTASQYFSNAPKVLNAVSDLTGAKDATTAMTHLNDLLGNSNLDLGNSQDASFAEDLLRRFKASARSAGISIESVMGILNTTKALAGQFPELKNVGNVGLMEMTTTNIQQSQALMATMGQNYVRGEGGMSNFVNSNQRLAMENKTELGPQYAKAVLAYISDGDFDENSKKNAISYLENFVSNPNSSFDRVGMNTLYSGVGEFLGRSDVEVYRASLSKGATARGEELQTEINTSRRVQNLNKPLADATKMLDLDVAAESATISMVRNLALIDLENVQAGKNPNLAADGRVLTAEEAYDKVFVPTSRLSKQNHWTKQGTISNMFSAAHIPFGGALDRFMNDPNNQYSVYSGDRYLQYQAKQTAEYKNAYFANVTTDTRQARDEANFAEHNAKFNSQADLLSTLGAELMSGRLGKGYSAISELVLTEPGRERSRAVLNSVKDMNLEQNDLTTSEAFYQLNGGSVLLTNEQVRNNLSAEGRGHEYANVIKRREAFAAGNTDRFLTQETTTLADKLSGKGVTLQQVMDSVNENKAKAKGMDPEKYFKEQSVFRDTGIKFEDVKKYAGLLRDSGLADAPTLEKFGDLKFDNSIARRIVTAKAMGISLDSMVGEERTYLNKTKSDSIKSTVADLQTAIPSDPKKEQARRSEAKKIIDSVAAIGGNAYSDDDVEVYDGKQVMDDLRAGKLNPELQSVLSTHARDYVTIDEYGKIVGADDKKFSDDAKNNRGMLHPAVREAMRRDPKYAKYKEGKSTGYDLDKILSYQDVLSPGILSEIGGLKNNNTYEWNAVSLDRSLKNGGVSKAIMKEMAEQKIVNLDKEGNYAGLNVEELNKNKLNPETLNEIGMFRKVKTSEWNIEELDRSLKNGGVSDHTLKQLADRKIVNLDKEGNYTGLNAEELKKASTSDANHNYLMTESAIAPALQSAKVSRDLLDNLAKSLAPTSAAMDKQAEALSGFSSMLGGASSELKGALDRIATALNEASKG